MYGTLQLAVPISLAASFDALPASGIVALPVLVPPHQPLGSTAFLQALLPGVDHQLANLLQVTVD